MQVSLHSWNNKSMNLVQSQKANWQHFWPLNGLTCWSNTDLGYSACCRWVFTQISCTIFQMCSLPATKYIFFVIIYTGLSFRGSTMAPPPLSKHVYSPTLLPLQRYWMILQSPAFCSAINIFNVQCQVVKILAFTNISDFYNVVGKVKKRSRL